MGHIFVQSRPRAPNLPLPGVLFVPSQTFNPGVPVQRRKRDCQRSEPSTIEPLVDQGAPVLLVVVDQVDGHLVEKKQFVTSLKELWPQ